MNKTKGNWEKAFTRKNALTSTIQSSLFFIFGFSEKLGHRSITSTQVYVQLLETSGKEEYESETDTTIEEMTKLIEQRFEYVTDTKIGETTYKLFRKKKAWRLE